MRLNFEKHFKEGDFKADYDAPYKTKRYIRKLMMRNNCDNLKVE